MKPKGIRILDKKNRIVTVKFSDILEEINNGDQFEWSILYLQTTGDLGEGKSIPDFEQQIIESELGFNISWQELKELAQKFWDLMDISVIATKQKSNLKRYESDQEMYETCDITIGKIDSGYWEVFSKDLALINRLAAKFKEVHYLESDFQK